MKKHASSAQCRKLGASTRIVAAAILMLAGGVVLCAPASASESGTAVSFEVSFLESASEVESLDSAALEQRRAGMNAASAPSLDTDGTVAIKLWDGWQQRRPNDSGAIGGSSATAVSTVMINGAIQ